MIWVFPMRKQECMILSSFPGAHMPGCGSGLCLKRIITSTCAPSVFL